MDVLTGVTVLLTLFTSLRVVCTLCVVNEVCEVLKSIKADPDNYRLLLNAFYPINWAKPFSVIIAYFINYTDPVPEECSLGTYPWMTYPGINYAYYNIHWYMRTTSYSMCGNKFHIFGDLYTHNQFLSSIQQIFTFLLAIPDRLYQNSTYT